MVFSTFARLVVTRVLPTNFQVEILAEMFTVVRRLTSRYASGNLSNDFKGGMRLIVINVSDDKSVLT